MVLLVMVGSPKRTGSISCCSKELQKYYFPVTLFCCVMIIFYDSTKAGRV